MVSDLAVIRIASVAVALLALAGCYSTGNGPDPPTALYFPVGLTVSPGGHALYVANSDFDLQFNSGTVETYHLDDIRRFLAPIWSVDSSIGSADICAKTGLGPNPTPILYPGACGAFVLESPPPQYLSTPMNSGLPPIASSARIGAFATDIEFVCHPPADPTQGTADCSRGGPDPRGARIFVPVRGDPSVTFFDVDDDRPQADKSFQQTYRLNCGQIAGGRCTDDHRIGIDASENTRGLTLPAEPFGIAVSDRADAIAVTHQIAGGAVSLITGESTAGNTVLDVKPRLEFVTGGLPAAATGITALPVPAVVSALGPLAITNYQEGFGVAYRGAAQVDVFRFFDDAFAAPARPFLSRVAAFGLTSATPSGLDSRSIALDRSASAPRVVCEQSCPNDATRAQCLMDKNCTRIPVDAFVANRSPSTLLIGQLTTQNPTSSDDSFTFSDAVTLAPGPSRVVVGRVKTGTENGVDVYETRIFVVCFDARMIFIYDPIRRRLDGEIRTGRGPHALVMDPVAPIAYLGHFTDSYIGLIDLDQTHAGTYASIVATIGAPQPPQDTQ
jgi:hypothetical protein